MKKLSNINKWYFFALVIANSAIADSVLAHGANIKHQQTPAMALSRDTCKIVPHLSQSFSVIEFQDL